MDPTLTHVRLLVDEYERCVRFYRDDPGFDPTVGDAGSGYADFDTGGVTLALFDADEMADSLDGAAGEDTREPVGDDTRGPLGDDTREPVGDDTREPVGDGVSVILRMEDVDSAYVALDDADCERVAPPRDRDDWGTRVAHLRDPDGTLVELNQPLGT